MLVMLGSHVAQLVEHHAGSARVSTYMWMPVTFMSRFLFFFFSPFSLKGGGGGGGGE